MSRSGIYVNGKEIVARYFGDKLLWKKSREKLFTTLTYSNAWETNFTISNLMNGAEFVQYFKTSVTDDLEFDITRIEIGNRSWNASKYYLIIQNKYYPKQRVITRIAFTNSVDMYSFINFTKSNPAGKITVYQEKR